MRTDTIVDAHDTRVTREEIIELLRLQRETDDESKWVVGDTCQAWLANVEHGQRMSELASLADASGYTYSGLRERHDNSAYWAHGSRKWEGGVITWSHYNRARRGVELPEAIERMEHADQNSLTVVAFEKYLKLEHSNATDPQPTTFRDCLLSVAAAVDDLAGRDDAPDIVKPALGNVAKILKGMVAAFSAQVSV